MEKYINDLGAWNEVSVLQNFSLIEAEDILDISLNMNGCNDIRIWMGSPNGKYFVKICYLKEINGSEPPLICLSPSVVVEVSVELSYPSKGPDIFVS